MIDDARREGHKLVLAINSDASVSALKGPTRPIVNQNTRARVRASLAAVDAVVVFEEPTPLELQPDVIVKGGDYMMDNNYTYYKVVLQYALRQGAPLVYASTAAVYGLSGPGHFTPTLENERPRNIYGFSKLTFDHYVRKEFALGRIESTVVGLRYFNVCGPHEQHKGRMASVIHHFTKQILESRKVRLFEGSGGYGNGEQRRDFVYVRDLARVNMFLAEIGPFSPAPGESPLSPRGW